MRSILSIFGECTGNVRSTPTPNDCLRTVKVSRTPAPWRLITTPSKTWMRRRSPSITWKWTRTVSPALNCGIPSRSCARSSSSMILLIREPAGGRPAANGSSHHTEALGRPVDREHLADDVPPRHRAPAARVARRRAVVSHHEVVVLRDLPRGVRLEVAAVPLDVRLVQALAVDE